MSVEHEREQSNILLVDDVLSDVRVLASLLEEAGYLVRATTNGPAALKICEKRRPSLLLLDILMSDMDGYEVCHRLKANKKTADIPVIFISALDDAEARVQGFESGGVDYISKPFNPVEVLARVNVHIQLEIAKRQLLEKNQELEKLAITDSLTRLFNRRHFMSELKRCCGNLRRYDTPFCLIMLDLDHFKQINDQFGHDVGDHVLQVVSECIRGSLRDVDFAARWGGEEFVIIAPNTTLEDVGLLIGRLQESMNAKPIETVGTVTASFGVVCSVREDSPEALIKLVDQAMYAAKAAGRNCVRFASFTKS
ncbi:MAG: diguanylate cyclase [Candidatus Thiodiazotropha sp. (ex Lucinoma kastoroae)]|nr:diguanylate cyclase [Candidatus Thiodiazotropha sp. (ex Rostrolucina anterorostrata)]MCU7846997.1 diguanylate cyclase [Candidatus Thiodiazotropha sp. (ex Lucinoma kastoroae)]MCU7858519.1 diguanylate cyclase [Candidatus Thiodiazotropha sp. (ex Lucinoma kastoroae)]